MPAYLFDASALVKRYLIETGTAWVNSVIDPAAANEIRLARLTAVEVISAISRRQRGGSITAAQAANLLANFRHEFANVFVVEEITHPLFAQAMDLAEKHGLRGADAVQLAVALFVNNRSVALGLPMTFVCADDDLNTAAEGLTVENPNDHP